VVYASAVLPLDSHILPGLNQETYQALQRSLQAVPPHQLWLAACDDIPLQRRLAAGLDHQLLPTSAGVSRAWLRVDPQRPDVAQQVLDRVRAEGSFSLPYLQILGVEQLTYCGSEEQARFLASLRKLAQYWPQIPCSLLIWLPRPWLRQVQRAAKTLAQLSDRTFEFLGDPTPLTDPEEPTQPLSGEWTTQQDNAATPELGYGSPPTLTPTSPAPEEPQPQTSTPPLGDPPEATEHRLTDSLPQQLPSSLWQQLEADLRQLEHPPAARKPAPPWEWGRSAPEALGRQTEPVSRPAIPVADAVAAELGAGARPSISEDWVAQTSTVTLPSVPDHLVPQPNAAEGRPATVEPRTSAAPLNLDRWLAQAMSPLALAYQWRDRVEAGDHHPVTLQTAIHQYEQVLAEPPIDLRRAEVLNDLGSLYWLLAQQTAEATERYRQLAQSKAHYEAALNLPGALSADTQVRLHSNLGSVYCLLASHGSAEIHLNQAVRAFHRALQSVDSKQDPEAYATLQTHLGTAYWSLAQHSADANPLHRAIAAYQEALIYRPAAVDPQAYGQIQNNLGIAYWSLAQHERPLMLLKQAIAAYEDVLAYRTLGLDPLGHGATQNNLGTAYWDLGRQYDAGSAEQKAAWEQAIAAYNAALAALTQGETDLSHEPVGFDPWATHHSVAVVHDQLALSQPANPGRQQHHWHWATHHYVVALEGWRHQQSPLVDTALQGLIQSLRHQLQAMGTEAQQRSLSQIPADWLPEVWRRL
jgi:tetratricopeptide (TPR) repeat protein